MHEILELRKTVREEKEVLPVKVSVSELKEKSMEELDMEYTLQPKHGVFVPYLDGLQKDLAHRD